MGETLLMMIPVPFLATLLCAALSVVIRRVDLGSEMSSQILAALFVVFALETVLVGLRFGYGIERFTLLQGILPLAVGPLTYLGFAALMVSLQQLKAMAKWHFGAAGVIVLIALVLPLQLVPLDWAISASYLFYAVALFLIWRRGSNVLIHARLEIARGVRRLMLWAISVLGLLFILDTAIALSFALRNEGLAVSFISFGSALLVLGLVLSFLILPGYLRPGEAPGRALVENEDDWIALEAQAREFMTKSQLYLDPELTVQRLAKRLHVPARKLSLAINESQGMNLSQYVNGFRLAHAAELLQHSDDSVSKVMAQSGFLTRSNFYREFQRVFGVSPAAYRKQKSFESTGSVASECVAD